jgi:hypothetical protein
MYSGRDVATAAQPRILSGHREWLLLSVRDEASDPNPVQRCCGNQIELNNVAPFLIKWQCTRITLRKSLSGIMMFFDRAFAA